MYEEPDDAFRDLLLDHATHPRNQREMADANRMALGHNRSCGDRVVVFLDVREEQVIDACFSGAGCTFLLASASMMTQAIRGQSLANVRLLLEYFLKMLLDWDSEVDVQSMGELYALQGLRRFPIRVKCAMLPWRALEAAIKGTERPVCTE
jgi:nitrogen fixation NifU-like protein